MNLLCYLWKCMIICCCALLQHDLGWHDIEEKESKTRQQNKTKEKYATRRTNSDTITSTTVTASGWQKHGVIQWFEYNTVLAIKN